MNQRNGHSQERLSTHAARFLGATPMADTSTMRVERYIALKFEVEGQIATVLLPRWQAAPMIEAINVAIVNNFDHGEN
jgi:hypothetical protein